MRASPPTYTASVAASATVERVGRVFFALPEKSFKHFETQQCRYWSATPSIGGRGTFVWW